MKTLMKQSKPIGTLKFHYSNGFDFIRIFITVIIGVLLSTDILASQSDPRLDALFSRLQTTLSVPEARKIESTIWKIWIESEQDEVNRLMQAGTSAIDQLDYGKALEVFNQMVAITPDFAEGWNKRATVHYLRKDFPSSILDIQRTLNLEPRHFGALSGLGLVYMALERYDSALIAFKDAMKIHPHLRGAQANIDAIRKHLSAVQI